MAGGGAPATSRTIGGSAATSDDASARNSAWTATSAAGTASARSDLEKEVDMFAMRTVGIVAFGIGTLVVAYEFLEAVAIGIS